MIQGAIFDMDGVLLDSMGMWEEVGPRYLVSQGKTPAPDLQKILFDMHMEEITEYFRSAYDLPWSAEEILSQITGMVHASYLGEILPKEGAREFLERLRQEKIPVAVATANERELAMAGLESTGLLPCIDAVFTCGELGVGKGSPAVYQAACSAIGTEISSTWVFEDSLQGVLTAGRAGFPTVGVYDAAGREREAEMRKHCTWYLETFADWKELWREALGK